MCLIISKPAGVDVSLDLIQSALDYNGDGVGIMANGGADRWVKIKPTKLQRKINALGAAAIHFRMATHGVIAHANVHPFRAIDGSQIMHNGVLTKYAPWNRKAATESDTAIFVRQFINPMLTRDGTIDVQAVANETAGNALAIMRPNGVIALTGSSWVDYEGLALSNTYAWDAPPELRGQWNYDIHETDAATESTSTAVTPYDYGTRYGSGLDSLPLPGKRLSLVYDAESERVANLDRAYELEDILLGELIARVDEVDFMDSDCTRHFDTLDYAAMLSDDISPQEFLERCSAESLLAIRIQLARRSG